MCSSNYQTVLWRDIRSLLHWKQVLRTNAASSAKQLSAQVLPRDTFKQSSMFNGVGLNFSYVAMCTCRCVHRTIKRSCDAIYEACCTWSKCCAQMLHQVQSNCRHKCCAQVLRSCANIYYLPFCAHHLSLLRFFTFQFFHVYIIVRFFTCPFFAARGFPGGGHLAFVKLFSFPK